MITLSVGVGGEIIANQFCTDPTVYLDLWALIDFSLDQASGDRFINSLLRRKGTLALSWLHFLELSQLSDQSQVDKVIHFLERVSPHLYFIDVIPKQVIASEDLIIQRGKVIAPHTDERFLKAFVVHRRATVNPLSIGEFLRDFRQSEVIKLCQTFMKELDDVLEEARKKARGSTVLAARIRQSPTGPQIPHATRYINIEAARDLVRNVTAGMAANDWRDLFHMIVPLAYCDVLLLDHRWATKAKEIVERIRRAGNQAQVAQVFSKRELGNFWAIFDV